MSEEIEEYCIFENCSKFRELEEIKDYCEHCSYSYLKLYCYHCSKLREIEKIKDYCKHCKYFYKKYYLTYKIYKE